MRALRARTVIGVSGLLLVAADGHAQFKNGQQTVTLTLPTVSQRAVVTQRIGLTDVTIVYHRPRVDGRKIFGDLIAYGRVWRAGANNNTTFEISDPVTVEGQPLAAGRYGLHAIPGPDQWTVIFSRNSTSWGSFTYDEKEDVLRVVVKPVAAGFREELTYEFSDLEPESAVLALTWERVRVPIRLAVDTKQITLESVRNQLRNLPGYTSEAWNDAAMYCLDNEFNYEEALRWADRSIQEQEGFGNLITKARVLEALDRQSEAKAVIEKALPMGNAVDLYGYADMLLKQRRLEDAAAVVRRNLAAHPDSWLALVTQARLQSATGERTAARKTFDQALSRAPAGGSPLVRRLIQRLEAGQDIR